MHHCTQQGHATLGMAATTLTSDDLKSEATTVDQRMLIMEMWNWYQPNSEKLMTLMATLDQVIFFFFIYIFIFWRHLVKK